MASSKQSTVLVTAFERYTLGKQIGQGGAGRVHAALDGSNKPVAIKLIDRARTSAEKARRFKNELMFCLRNTHPNILTVSDYGTTSGTESDPFYVMPMYGGTLRSLLEHGVARDQVVPLFAQVLDGVEAAHLRGVVHRDLKPENILYDQSNNRMVVADFGVAQFTDEELVTLVETKPGTRLANFQYAAPEQRARGASVDARSDIFALGLILCEMLTGEVPQGTGYKTIADAVPSLAYLDEVVARMIQQAPANRFQRISELKTELEARGIAFIQQQKLDSLRQIVLPASDVSDPFVLDPPRAENVDYRDGQLIFTLSKAPHAGWINAFRSITGVSYYPGQGPMNFQFSGREASIGVSYDDQAPSLVNMFKEYLRVANIEYERQAREALARSERERKQRLQKQIEAEERRQGVLKTLKL